MTFFMVNRHLTETLETSINLAGFGNAGRITLHEMIRHDDLEAVNTATAPDTVAPRPATGADLDGSTVNIALPSLSYQVLRIKI
ncbi:hypothetical protein E2K80_11475 [Rhodophyticola sp. CCM32]|nr:hypothetical protein E2K80_11475 [Rhodophyticola sp. CCM32]